MGGGSFHRDPASMLSFMGNHAPSHPIDSPPTLTCLRPIPRPQTRQRALSGRVCLSSSSPHRSLTFFLAAAPPAAGPVASLPPVAFLPPLALPACARARPPAGFTIPFFFFFTSSQPRTTERQTRRRPNGHRSHWREPAVVRIGQAAPPLHPAGLSAHQSAATGGGARLNGGVGNPLRPPRAGRERLREREVLCSRAG